MTVSWGPCDSPAVRNLSTVADSIGAGVDVRAASAGDAHSTGMADSAATPSRLLLVGRLRELSGDHVGAVVAYRQVILSGEPATAAEARRRLEALVVHWAGRPA
jgi:hypothetical protein